MTGVELLGRAEELAVLGRFLERAQRGPAMLLIEGEAGIGKTTLWCQGVRSARERGFRILACQPAPTETPLSFTALGDLLTGVLDEYLPRLPTPQRRALEASLLLSDPGNEAPDQRSVSLAVLTLLRSVAEAGPLLIAIDDILWADAPSARVLTFALRRVRIGSFGVLLTRRTVSEGGNELSLALDGAGVFDYPLERCDLGPLSLGAIGRLIRLRLGKRPSRPELAELYRAASGNPLHALELAQAQVERDLEAPRAPMRVPEALSAVVSEHLARLPAATQQTLLIAAALSEPTVGLVKKAGGGSLTKAVDEGVVELDGSRIRFTHPLYASVLYARASPERRKKLHHCLTAVVENPEERARQLALGADEPNEAEAVVLDGAARQADARGAPETAAEFYEHAARLTPPEQVDDVQRRRMASAEHYYLAGDLVRARALAEAVLVELPAGPWRADALVLLADMVADQTEAVRLCRQAVEAAAGDDYRLALASIRLGAAYARLADPPDQLEAQRAALEPAERSGDRRLIIEALQGVVNATILNGGGVDEAAMERALALEQEIGELPVRHSPRYWLGTQLYLSDELERARPLLRGELERAIQSGEVTDRLHISLPVIDLETRIGDWGTCERLLEDGLELAADIGQEYTTRYLHTFRLQLDVLRGEVELARPTLARLLEQAKAAGDRPQVAHLLALSGLLELSIGNPAAAWRSLEPAISLQSDLGRSWCCASPIDYFTIPPNAVEALVGLGQIETAEELLAGFETRARRAKRPVGLVSAARERALVESSQGRTQKAETALKRAFEAQERLPDPFERGRTLLLAGTVQRQTNRKRAAREALEQAAGIFAELGASLWLEKARGELSRVGGRRPAGSELTETEARVAELVARGSSNKEVAQALYMSVRAVEANLSKVYRKLGVASRAELAKTFSRRKKRLQGNLEP
jgi:DNA-binding CsgD family transcriptional regulator